MASLAKHLSIASQVKRIKRELVGVVERTSQEVGGTLLTQGALLASEIKSVAPVDPDSATPGALRDSVRLEEGAPTPRKAIVVKVKAGNSQTKKQGKTGKAYDYGRAVEFGTQDMPPRPFFFPIYRARKKAIKTRVRKAIKQAVKGSFK